MSIKSIIREISPTADEINQISVSGNSIRSCIESKIPFVCDSLLTGSYKRGTKISPIDDLDIIFQVKAWNTSVSKMNSENDSYILTISENDITNHILKDYTVYSSDNRYIVSPIKILNSIKSAIKETYSTTEEINRNGECITVYLSSYDFTIDCMPYILVNNQDYMLIPSGNNSLYRKKTNPKTDEYEINRLDGIDCYNGLFKDVIKIFKFWNREHNPIKLRSYLIECIAYNFLAGKSYLYKSSHLNILKELLKCIYNDYQRGVLDIPGYSYVNYNLDRNQKTKLNNSLNEFYKYLDDEDDLIYFLNSF